MSLQIRGQRGSRGEAAQGGAAGVGGRGRGGDEGQGKATRTGIWGQIAVGITEDRLVFL